MQVFTMTCFGSPCPFSGSATKLLGQIGERLFDGRMCCNFQAAGWWCERIAPLWHRRYGPERGRSHRGYAPAREPLVPARRHNQSRQCRADSLPSSATHQPHLGRRHPLLPTAREYQYVKRCIAISERSATSLASRLQPELQHSNALVGRHRTMRSLSWQSKLRLG